MLILSIMFNKIINYIGEIFFREFLDDPERIVYIAHRHVFVYYKKFLKKAFFGLFIPLFVWYLFPDSYVLMSIWAIIGGLIFLYQVMDWYFDAILITNTSLKIITWNGFFDSTATTFEYEKIEGVSWSRKGFFQTVFGYGDVTVERIGSGTPFILHDAVNPKLVEKHILGQQGSVVQESSLKNYETLHGLLTDMLLQHKSRSGK